VYGATHIGGKTANEDAYRFSQEHGILAVADGVAGLSAPRVAADAAIEALFEYLTDSNVTPAVDGRARMERTLTHVNRCVREQAKDDLAGMATSLACVVERGPLLLVGHVGECRVVRVRGRQVDRLTIEHRRGTDPLVLTRATQGAAHGSARDAPSRAIGLGDTLAPATSIEVLQANDGILVGSAGLMGAVTDQMILEAAQPGRHPSSVIDALFRAALAKPVADNMTGVYARWRALGNG
jgi:serine/threonine protein phosphatase PrpC